MVIGSGWNGLDPLRHVVNRDQDIQVPTRWGKWPHKVYTPTIKDIYDKYRIEGHHVPPSDASKFLAIFAFLQNWCASLKRLGQ